ncbi:MAG: Hsp20/alpha crystallin family protein [Desulfovibrionaceae bacterium]
MPNFRLWSENELSRLKDDMERLFDGLCLDFGLPGTCVPGEELRVSQQEDRIVVRLCAAGLEPGDLKVDATATELEIHGRVVRSVPGGTASSAFARRISLPCRVRPAEVLAKLKDGVLTIEMPRCADDVCRSIDIIKE